MLKIAFRFAGASILLGSCVVYGNYVAEAFEVIAVPEPRVNPQAESEFRQAMDYIVGRGVEADENMAFGLITRSAQQGFSEAQFMLGNAYYRGVLDRGVNQDYRKAYIWYSLAALGGYTKASVLRYEVSAFLSPAELILAKKEITNFQKTVSNNPAQY